MLAELIRNATQRKLCVSFQPDFLYNNYLNIIISDGQTNTKMQISYEALRLSRLSTDEMLADSLARVLAIHLNDRGN